MAAGGPVAAQVNNGSVIISQLYGGGGGSGTFRNDFVELYNTTASPINLSGLSLQYGSATGNIASTASNAAALSGTIQPGRFFLVEFAQSAGTGATLPVAADQTVASPTLQMAAANGKISLVNGTTFLNSLPAAGTETASPFVDFVGYGGTANRFEGTGPAPTLSSSTSAVRVTSPGQTTFDPNGVPLDTNSNISDFITQSLVGTPVIRNSAFVPVPEPATVGLIAAAGLGLAGFARRRLAG